MTLVTTEKGYLTRPYLSGPYLGGTAVGAMGMQALFTQANALGMQVLFTIYNTTNLRILCNFLSRGNAARVGEGNNAWGNPLGIGENIQANSTQPGDFSAENLNTDVVEQIWRSADTVKTGVRVDFDTERDQGVFLDTFSIQNHNLTRSATVTLIGSVNSNFSTTDVVHNIQISTDPNAYFIAETLPAAGYRYWRIAIDDPTNPDDYVSMGTVVFGASRIFNAECIVDQIDHKLQDFADTVNTEGFTNVANSRAQKKVLRLEFRSLETGFGNFELMRDIFKTARTTLKCLWIPTPSFINHEAVERFAVFSKLSEIPNERHNSKGPSDSENFVSFSIELDESR